LFVFHSSLEESQEIEDAFAPKKDYSQSRDMGSYAYLIPEQLDELSANRKLALTTTFILIEKRILSHNLT